MKSSLLLAASLFALAAHLPSPAHAQTSPLSRAEVKAEFLRARAAGELPSSADLFGPALQQAMPSAKTKQVSASSPAKTIAGEQPALLASPQAAASAAER
jgi:hypothetical protein